MQKYGVVMSHKDDALTIFGQTLPLYYTKNRVDKTPETKNFINLAYKDGIVPIEYKKLKAGQNGPQIK